MQTTIYIHFERNEEVTWNKFVYMIDQKLNNLSQKEKKSVRILSLMESDHEGYMIVYTKDR